VSVVFPTPPLLEQIATMLPTIEAPKDLGAC
jgi:hypothetical protein